jgi:uncharacterized damage-inducible protein DinB
MDTRHSGNPLQAHLLQMARYGHWATQRLYAGVERLGDDAYHRDVGLFFKSVHGTLNHLLVTELELWQRRFLHGESRSLALDAELEPERARLRQRLLDGTAAWLPWLEALDAGRLEGRLEYVSTEGKPMSMPFAATLAHVFNHGTHHRGQASAGLTVLGQEAPVMDLLWMLREQAAGPAGAPR